MSTSARSSWLRAMQAFCEQVCEKETLPNGIAFYSAEYPDEPEAQHFREMIYENAESAKSAVEAAESFFAQNGLRPQVWTPAVDHDPGLLKSALAERGFHEKRFSVLRLASWSKPIADGTLRILPARAVRSALGKLFVGQSSDLFNDRLDDPRFDMYVGLKGAEPVARGGLFQVGDIGVVKGVHIVQPEFEREIVEHLLVLAQRLQLPRILARVDAGASDLLSLYESLGFEVEGELVEFVRI